MGRILALLFLGFICCNHAKDATAETKIAKNYTTKNEEALAYCQKNKFNEDYYFLVDMSIHPGKNRFFVYDFKQKEIVDQNLVTHGSCDAFANNEEKWEKAKFDNKLDSHCTALGKYKIGKRDTSAWGIKIKYWLKGLEKSNDNAENRVVVLHSWNAVSDKEIYPKVSPLSWGCPAVSDHFMRKLDVKLKATKKPVLLWIVQ